MKNITNVYESVSANRWKSTLIMVFFFAFFFSVTWLFAQVFGYGINFLAFGLIFSGVSIFISYWYSDKIILSISSARPAERKKDFHFYTVTENLAMSAGLPMPKLYVIEDSAPNAFATGRDPAHAVVCVTTGLLQKLDRTELEGVIGHELSHIGNYDTRLMSIVAILAGLIVLMSDWIMRSSFHRSSDDNDKASPLLMVLALVLMILSPIIAMLIKASISQRREYLADASSVKLTRFPDGLARALAKISQDREPLEVANKATAHLYITNPFKEDARQDLSAKSAVSTFANLFNTHPPIEKRIEALKRMV